MNKGIMKQIKREIEEKSMKHGFMGTERVTIIIKITEEEKEEFLNQDLDNHWCYEIEDNELTVSYTEEI